MFKVYHIEFEHPVHLATVHEGKKNYQCSQCDSAFKSNQGLRNHFEGKHCNQKRLDESPLIEMSKV